MYMYVCIQLLSFCFCANLIQIVKMNQSGEVSVEKGPYNWNQGVKDELAKPEITNNSEAITTEATERTVEPPEPTQTAAEDKEETTEEKKEKKKSVSFKESTLTSIGSDVKLRNPISRSQTVCNRPLRRSVDLRRQSLCNLKKGQTGELGSKGFRRALQKDSVYEIHPGWESIRKLSKVVG